MNASQAIVDSLVCRGASTTAEEWYVAPAADPSDRWAAGYDGNSFPSRQAAEAEIPALRRCGDDFASTEWVAVRCDLTACGGAS